MYTHESLNNRGVIKNEELKISIEDHTGRKKPSSKENNKLGLVTLWLDVQETKAYEPKEWTIVNNSQLHKLRNEEIT